MWIQTGDNPLDPKLVPVEELSTAEVHAHLNRFRASFHKQHGRPIRESDSKDLPEQILALFDQVGRRLTPEQLEAANARLEAQRASDREKAAQAAAERAAALEARAHEWAAFEANKERLWRSAVGDAKDQRLEVAQAVGLARPESLSGAASLCKVDVAPPSAQPTREQFIEQALDLNGLRFVADPKEAPGEADEWRRNGGDEADMAATREAWLAKNGPSSTGAEHGSVESP